MEVAGSNPAGPPILLWTLQHLEYALLKDATNRTSAKDFALGIINRIDIIISQSIELKSYKQLKSST